MDHPSVFQYDFGYILHLPLSDLRSIITLFLVNFNLSTQTVSRMNIQLASLKRKSDLYIHLITGETSYLDWEISRWKILVGLTLIDDLYRKASEGDRGEWVFRLPSIRTSITFRKFSIISISNVGLGIYKKVKKRRWATYKFNIDMHAILARHVQARFIKPRNYAWSCKKNPLNYVFCSYKLGSPFILNILSFRNIIYSTLQVYN